MIKSPPSSAIVATRGWQVVNDKGGVIKHVQLAEYVLAGRSQEEMSNLAKAEAIRHANKWKPILTDQTLSVEPY